jgi:hypothetical protein
MFTPTPPSGDMVWAASPMQSRPGFHHFSSRSTPTVKSLRSSTVASSCTRSARNGINLTMRSRNFSMPAAFSASAEPLAMT